MSNQQAVENLKNIFASGLINDLSSFHRNYGLIKVIVDNDRFLVGRMRLDNTTKLPRVLPNDDDWLLFMDTAKRMDNAIKSSSVSSENTGSFSGMAQTVGDGIIVASFRLKMTI